MIDWSLSPETIATCYEARCPDCNSTFTFESTKGHPWPIAVVCCLTVTEFVIGGTD